MKTIDAPINLEDIPTQQRVEEAFVALRNAVDWAGTCPHCPPDRVWAHEHVGDTKQLLLVIVRDVPAHKEWYFHGTQAQCDAYLNHARKNNYADGGQERFEELLLLHKDWDKALAAL